jgi:hypothetical protein
MDKNQDAMKIFQGYGFQWNKRRSFSLEGLNYWHPGFAWAITRKAYERIGGLYDYGILGSGDFNMCMSYIGKGSNSINNKNSKNYMKTILDFQEKAKNLRIGYTPGIIRHYFHGSKKNRKYTERWIILVNHQFDPFKHIIKNKDGIYVPTSECPVQLLKDITIYFSQRNEDE